MYINQAPTIYPIPNNLTTTVSASAGVSYNYNVYATMGNMPLPPQIDPIESVIIEPILKNEVNWLTDEAKQLLAKTTGVLVPEGALALYVPKQKVDWSDVALVDDCGTEIEFLFKVGHGWLWLMAEATFPLEFAYKAMPVYQPSTWAQDPWNQIYGPGSGYLPYNGNPGNIFVGTGGSTSTPINVGGYVPTSTTVTYGVNQPVTVSTTFTDPADGTTSTVVNLADWVASKTVAPEILMSPEQH